MHGPVIYEDRARTSRLCSALGGQRTGRRPAIWRAWRWRAPTTGTSFVAAMERYKVPSENIVYADTEGNIGWQAAGMAPDPQELVGRAARARRHGRLRMERISPHGRTAARVQSADALHRHRQPQHSAAGIHHPAGLRVGAALPLPSHRRNARARRRSSASTISSACSRT